MQPSTLSHLRADIKQISDDCDRINSVIRYGIARVYAAAIRRSFSSGHPCTIPSMSAAEFGALLSELKSQPEQPQPPQQN